MTKYERAKNLRYKKGALSTLGWAEMQNELYEIEEACADIHWFFEGDDGDSLVAALDGDEDEAYEFKMAFAELEADCERVRDLFEYDYENVGNFYDDCTVALIGNRYQVLGFDTVEEDYFRMTQYEQELSTSEAGKRVMRWTKSEMISKIGQCMSIALAFIDLRQRYDYLKATMDILRDENMSILQTIKDIETEYEMATDAGEWQSFNKLLSCLPDRVWLE